jgi:ATP-binding cassette subfamily F protein uup
VCNEIIELDNGRIIPIQRQLFLLFRRKKEERIASENSSVDKAQNFCEELEWMRRQPKQN